jgi:hypothetical protein
MRRATVGLAVLAVAAVCALSLFLSPPAEALSVSSLSIAKSAGNFADATDNTGDERSQLASDVAIILGPGGAVADTLGASNTFSTRYFSLLAADADGKGKSVDTGTQTSDYRVTFTVDVGLGVSYTLKLDTKMFGALTLVDDQSGKGKNATAEISDVTGKLGGGTLAGLGLATSNKATTDDGSNMEINQSNTLTIVATGTQTFTLDFTWTGRALSNPDEAAVRLGFAGTLSDVTADDYPGVGSRKANCSPGTMGALGACSGGGFADGHFLTVLVTITDVPGPPGVPGPAPLLLLGLGAVGLGGGVAWRRRRTGR